MKEKLKVYHGLPKTPTNENTLFYASFDGSVHPEIHHGPMIKQGEERSFSAGITGYCLKEINNRSEITYEFPEYATNNLPEVSTVDLWAYYPGYQEGKIMRFAYAMFSDLIILQDEYLYVGFWRDRLRVKKLEKGYYHFRLILKPLNRTTGETSVDLYINGKKEGTYVTTISDSENPPATVSLGHMNNDSYACAVSDVHVSLEDLGDYFPTLPQDFIDEKAIVVPALNQRQSYGDPVLHQVTELVVKNQPSEILGTIYDLNDRDADGLERCFTNPELRTAYAHTWEQGFSKIRIQGLNNSVITGVFDTNTAKAKVIKSSYAPNTKLYLDTVEGLSVGDTVVLAEVSSTEIWMTDYTITIQGINTTEKSITIPSCDWNVTAGKHYIFETTASSSSPIVETVDGFTVNGTWSGLGTRQATFTFGSNSNVSGKDLIVKYCLTAVGSSSPYPKMPSEVIRGYDELGNEMIPVSSVEIEDDFTGKIKGDTSTCFHTIKSYAASSLLAPASSVGEEVSQDHYNKINNPGDFVTISTSANNAKVQVRFDFDLFKMLEQKLGEEVSLSWVQNNVAHIKLNAICKGSSHRGAYVEARYYDPKNMEWKLNSGGYSNSTSSFAKISATYSGDLIRNKNTNCFFMVTCSSSDGSSSSFVQIKEVWVNVKLKTGDVYDVLYTKDTNARVSPCNPILVDKQTKEVKRLLPSKTPFSTEVIVHNPTRTSQMSNDEITLYQNPQGFVTTQGSGSSAPMTEALRGLIGKLGISSYQYTNENLVKLPVTGFSQSYARNMFVQRQFYPTQLGCHEPKELGNVLNSVFICCDIINLKGTLYLKVIGYTLNDVNKAIMSIKYYYTLPNRPLIK